VSTPRHTDDRQALVHVVDDDPSMRTALARLLSAAGYRVCTHADAGAFLIAAGDAPEGCLVLDLHMPGPDGLALYEALRRRGMDVPTVFLTGRGDIPSSVRALKAGASDFLTKPVDADRLLEAVRSALAADAPRRAERERRRLLAKRFESLDARERTVLRRVLQGALTKQIADELRLSERTVKSCRAAMMRKLAAGSLQELVRIAADLPAEGGPGPVA
jgi:FixJ family two-component response regulator